MRRLLARLFPSLRPEAPNTVDLPASALTGYTRLTLVDVQGLFGGTCIYIDGQTHKAVFRALSRGCHVDERRSVVLGSDDLAKLDAQLQAHDLTTVSIPLHNPVPDESCAVLMLERADTAPLVLSKWARQREPNFEAVYTHLLALAEHYPSTPSQQFEGYDTDWRPQGFSPIPPWTP